MCEESFNSEGDPLLKILYGLHGVLSRLLAKIY